MVGGAVAVVVVVVGAVVVVVVIRVGWDNWRNGWIGGTIGEMDGLVQWRGESEEQGGGGGDELKANAY